MSISLRFNHDDFDTSLLARQFDGSAHHHAVLCAGLRGHVNTRHGAPDRWDWGVTVQTLRDAEQRHERMQKLADSLSPEQKAALWGSTDQWAAELRRFAR